MVCDTNKITYSNYLLNHSHDIPFQLLYTFWYWNWNFIQTKARILQQKHLQASMNWAYVMMKLCHYVNVIMKFCHYGCLWIHLNIRIPFLIWISKYFENLTQFNKISFSPFAFKVNLAFSLLVVWSHLALKHLAFDRIWRSNAWPPWQLNAWHEIAISMAYLNPIWVKAFCWVVGQADNCPPPGHRSLGSTWGMVLSFL